MNSRRYQNNDIFNSNPIVANNYNSFRGSNKKVENTNRIFGQSNDEKKLIANPKSKRPDQIRNVFSSQISIS